MSFEDRDIGGLWNAGTVGALAWPSNDEVCRAGYRQDLQLCVLQLHFRNFTRYLHDDTIAA